MRLFGLSPFAAIALLALVAGCAPRTPMAPVSAALPAPPPPPVLVDPEIACLRDLSRLGLSFETMPAFVEQDACGIANPVKIAAPLNQPGVMSCRLARTLARFEADVVQPLALRHFGQKVKRLHHAGTYHCRTRRNDTTQAAARAGKPVAGRLSEHARGAALDLTGFELADGTLVSVRRHWAEGKPGSTFLHDVTRGSCRVFNVVLSPNHDKSHADHLHLDIGPDALCGY